MSTLTRAQVFEMIRAGDFHDLLNAFDDLRTQLSTMTQERDEACEEVAWYGSLVSRTNIGTAATPSLRAYIEQCDATILGLTQQLASLTAERDKWKRWAIHRVPTHGTCCTCQRCGLDHDSCRCDFEEVCDELDKLKQQLATVTQERDEWKGIAGKRLDTIAFLSPKLAASQVRIKELEARP